MEMFNLVAYLEVSSGCPLNSFTNVLDSTNSEAGNENNNYWTGFLASLTFSHTYIHTFEHL